MLETNIRLVLPGPNLYVWTKSVNVTGPDVTPDLLQKACGILRHRHGLAAVPADDDRVSLLVATNRPVAPLHLEGDNWELDVSDANTPARRLTLADAEGRDVIPQLIERALEATLARHTDLWTLDSPRIWYELKPFIEEDGIAAFRRYEICSLLIEGEGIGVAVDIGTAFFTVETLAYFFDLSVPGAVQCQRAKRFTELTKRQEGQKGTLLYDNSRNRMTCYFERPPEGATCATTGRIRLERRSFDSLYEYYRSEIPSLSVSEDTPAVRVSFRHGDRPVWVAADRLWARVMNDEVPESLSSVDKIPPTERRQMAQDFWRRLGSQPLGGIAPGVRDNFWRPHAGSIAELAHPILLFGNGQRLEPPVSRTPTAYRAYYRQRGDYFEKYGCFSVPPAMPRRLYCAYPKQVVDGASCLAADITQIVSTWSGVPMNWIAIEYEEIMDAVAQLRAADTSGVVLFVLNDEPTAYHEAAFHLADWRIKRVTERVLRRHYSHLTKGAWDKRSRSMSLALGRSRWRSFVTLDALDLLQSVDAIPFGFEQAGPYEAHLVIDVGHDRRHFALSLLIARPTTKTPGFRLVTHAVPKTDHQHEAINPVVLADQIVELVQSTLRPPANALSSVLILRDGRLGGREIDGIDRAIDRLVDLGRVLPGARADLAEIHKDTRKSLRLWEVQMDGTVENPLEGKAVRFSDGMVLVTSTGAATLHQGTAEPYLIVANGRCSSVLDAAEAAFCGAQLNWSSPTVAQRLHVALKRTDEELKARASQEIRRLR